MEIAIISLFPQMLAGVFNTSILKRAQEKNAVSFHYINLRDFATDNYGTVDDHPYGGGVGMVLKVDVADRSIQYAKEIVGKDAQTILLDPKGSLFTQTVARQLATTSSLIFFCGHYEGVDSRIEQLVDKIYSIGDFILTGGEIPTMAIVDAIVRLVPGVLPQDATRNESFSQKGVLEAPHFTRPAEYKGMLVPDILLSGDHKRIETWRKDHSQKTGERKIKKNSPKS